MSERDRRVFLIKLDAVCDADVIGRIEVQPSFVGYVRELVRRDMYDERLDFAALKASELQAENAKLRELARDLYECVSHANEQDWFYFERNTLGCGMCCTVNGEGCGLSVLTDRLRELGVDE